MVVATGTRRRFSVVSLDDSPRTSRHDKPIGCRVRASSVGGRWGDQRAPPPGTRVRVLGGRQFRDFGAGDRGLVIKSNPDAGTCDIAFDGRLPDSAPVQVAARHLGLDDRPEPCMPSASETVVSGPSEPELGASNLTHASQLDGAILASEFQNAREAIQPCGVACETCSLVATGEGITNLYSVHSCSPMLSPVSAASLSSAEDIATPASMLFVSLPPPSVLRSTVGTEPDMGLVVPLCSRFSHRFDPPPSVADEGGAVAETTECGRAARLQIDVCEQVREDVKHTAIQISDREGVSACDLLHGSLLHASKR